ncbi:MAG: PfkB family carbohydrate kinase, partial [Clostridiales bacterium]
MGLLVVGSIALDTVETPFDRIDNALGGSAVYVSLAASYFSGPVHMVGVVGEDFGKEHIALLEDHHVDIEGLQVV